MVRNQEINFLLIYLFRRCARITLESDQLSSCTIYCGILFGCNETSFNVKHCFLSSSQWFQSWNGCSLSKLLAQYDKKSKHSYKPIMSSIDKYNDLVLKNHLVVHCSSSHINDLHTTLIRILNSPPAALITDPRFLN